MDTNSIIGYVFDGSYGFEVTGITGSPVYFQSGNVLVDSGRLISGYGINEQIISGLSATPSNISGYIFYNVNVPITSSCQGIGSDANTWFLGQNYYNGFHQAGYFSPPFGENLSVYLSNEDGYAVLAENGSCNSLTVQEYNDLFGIVTQLDPAIDSSSDSATAFINSPAIGCPQDVSVTFYWHEKQLKIIAGTAAAITANTFYNDAPIPNSLDNFNVKTAFRYSYTSSGTDILIPNGDGTSYSQVMNIVQYESGKPLPNYITTQGSGIINNSVCPGIMAEGSLENSDQFTESQLLDNPDDINSQQLGAFDPDNWWHLWHHLYKENSNGFPFENNYTNLGNDEGVAGTTNQTNVGTELFEAELSDSDEYWNRRQCSEAINYLPHTFGGAIYACASYYFDVPYYAAIKKFGFYGTRFLNGCVSLDMEYPQSGQTDTQDLDLPWTGYSYPAGDEPEPDLGTNNSFASYTNLLRVAAAEESQTDFYALNKILFLWANSGLITGSTQYQSLTGNSGFLAQYNNMFSQYNSAFPNGTGDLLNLNNSLFTSGSVFYNTGATYDFLSNNNSYKTYKPNILKTFTGSNDLVNWEFIESNYGVAVLQSLGNVNSGFYYQLDTQKQQRLQTRYLENYVNGNPIDLYPTNKIYFAYDSASGFINGSGWGKAPFGGYGANATFNDTGLARRFFLGAYGDGEDVSTFENFVNTSANINISGSSFYPGYFNSNIGVELPIPSYTPIISGYANSGNGDSPISGNWFAIGYNGIGELNANFSCFTPIFVQQPFNRTYCKIGQSPTFRAFAVDYHTIPEDKINIRYPEIVYWTTKLKMVDSNYNNLYPLSYKWYRILKSNCVGTIPDSGFQNFLLNPDFTLLEPSNPTGNWCALEGDGQYCTLIHPNQCVPIFSENGAWSYEYANTPAYGTAKQNNFYMTFKQGAIKGDEEFDGDDDYYYFCMARGRFGIRISEPSELFIEDWLSFDITMQNGGNIIIPPPSIEFQGNLTGIPQTIVCDAESLLPYGGFQRSNDFIPEDVIKEKLPPPNAGFGDVYSYTFVGMWGYGGATQTYSPGTLNDTVGLQETWGRLLHYGNLIQYFTNLTQTQGDFLYGTNHLPTCVSGSQGYGMPVGQAGIKVAIDGLVHLSNILNPVTTTSESYGTLWGNLDNAGELYTPAFSPSEDGQWQFGTNLGTIHNFGWNSNTVSPKESAYDIIQNGDLGCIPSPNLTVSQLSQLKQSLLKDGVLGGSNCGWNKYGLGMNMLYWVEGNGSFYLYCDQLKKKNVANLNYIGPGLRAANSSIQYFWMGKPSNSYLDRYPLFGPYAYEWKVRKQNRDRNGNGFSEGFYSYGWNTNYTQMYDAPAIYGLFIKYQNRSDASTLATIASGRNYIMSNYNVNLQNLKTTSFGFIPDNGQEGMLYGNIFLGELNQNYPANLYVQAGEANAAVQKTELYGCSDEDLLNGNCFDPCLSMRYQFGFLPGGKKQLFTTGSPQGSYNLVPNNLVVDGEPSYQTATGGGDVRFRGTFGTPHYQYLLSGLSHAGYTVASQELNGFSPCFDGGGDHCNYITPVLNLGTSMYLERSIPAFVNNAILASNSVNL